MATRTKEVKIIKDSDLINIRNKNTIPLEIRARVLKDYILENLDLTPTGDINIDGGSASSLYLLSQNIDGGGA